MLSPHSRHVGPLSGRRRPRRWLGALSLLLPSVAILCALSTLLHVTDVRSEYTDHPFRRDWSALSTWTARVDPLSAGSLSGRVAVQSSPWLSAWRPPSPPPTSVVPVPSRRRRYAPWPYHVSEVHCPCRVEPPTPSTDTPLRAAQTTLVSVFIHGNAGDARQGDYWSCALALRHQLTHADTRAPQRLRLFAVSLAGQANVHRGALLRRQADFVADAVEQIVLALAAEGTSRGDIHVWLVGHSMGGVVARLAASLLPPTPPLVHGVLTFNTPHRHPPLFMDASMSDVYAALQVVDSGALRALASPSSTGAVDSDAWVARALSAPVATPDHGQVSGGHHDATVPATRLISLTSGAHDLQIASASTALDSIVTPVTPEALHDTNASTSLPQQMWIDGSVWCDGSRSHDGILLNPCLQALASAALLAPTPARWSDIRGTSIDTRATRRWYARWGEVSCAWELWPLALCVFVIYVQCAALHGLPPHSWPLSQLNNHSELMQQAILFFMVGRIADAVRRVFSEGYGAMWLWSSPTASAAGWRGAVTHCVAACGPLAVGLLAGKWCVTGTSAAATALSRICFHTCDSGAHLPSTHRFWIGTAAVVYIVVACTDVCDLTVRAMVCLVVCLLHTAWLRRVTDLWTTAPSAPTPQPLTVAGQEETPHSHAPLTSTTAVLVSRDAAERGPTHLASPRLSVPPRATEVSAGLAAALTLYAFLFVLALQPFFVFRNALVSQTRDTHLLVDPHLRLAEVTLVMCFGTSVCIGSGVTHSREGWWARALRRVCASVAVQTAVLWVARLGMVLYSANVLDSWRAAVAVVFATPALVHTAFIHTAAVKRSDSPPRPTTHTFISL